jgi:hypothetical protein
MMCDVKHAAVTTQDAMTENYNGYPTSSRYIHSNAQITSGGDCIMFNSDMLQVDRSSCCIIAFAAVTYHLSA